MGITTGWQEEEEMEARLAELLRGDPAVEAVAVVGSGARGEVDEWSDLDLLLVVRAEDFARFFPGLEWLAPLGRIYAVERHPGEFSSVARVCFEDLRRVDAIVTTVTALRRHAEWPGRPFATGSRLLFSRNPDIDQILGRTYEVPAPRVPDGAFAALAEGFWFKAVVAVQKVVRGDRLVAFHLSLEMIQEVAVLAMMLRDRATGTSQHRDGVGDEYLADLAPAMQPPTPAGILSSIEQSAIAFDLLARRWSSEYQARRGPLLEWIAAAREAVDG